MTRDQEAELFQHLVRTHRVTDWVQGQLDEQIRILLVNPSHESILKAQGAAAVYKLMLDKLEAAKAALSR